MVESNLVNSDLQIVVCHSEDIDSEDAAKELIEQGESKPGW